MAFTWRKTDEFCSIWSAAKPRVSRTVSAIGAYPSDRPKHWKTTEPVLPNVLKPKTRPNEATQPVFASPLKPATVPKPTIELLPSTDARYPRSLTHRNLLQIQGHAWTKPGTSAIWNVVVQKGCSDRFSRARTARPKASGLEKRAG